MRTAILALFLTACSGGEAPAPTEPEPEPEPAKTEEPVAPEFKAAPEGATIAFGEPADGAEVTSPLKIVMQVEGMTVKKAGAVEDGTGHHHLIIDGGPTELGTVVPADDTHIHYGDGRTETEVELAPGEHTLTLQFADGLHRSYGDALSATITVKVKE